MVKKFNASVYYDEHKVISNQDGKAEYKTSCFSARDDCQQACSGSNVYINCVMKCEKDYLNCSDIINPL